MTKQKKPTAYFGAIPMRAFADGRLSCSHLKVLGVISYFDRFGKNGSGCYATQETIAKYASCTDQTVNRRMKDLREWAYIESSRQRNRRRMQHRVIHDTCPPGQVSNASDLSTRTGQEGKQLSERLNKDIPLRGLTDSCHNPLRHPPQTLEKNSPEGAYQPIIPAPPYGKNREIWEVSEAEWWSYKAQLYRHVKDQNPVSREAAMAVDTIVGEIMDADLGNREIEMAFESITYELPEI